MYWIYKCNSRKRPYQVAYGNWEDFFAKVGVDEWGSTEWVPALRSAHPGDTILAYQTDRNELVGLATVVRLVPRGQFLDLLLRPSRLIGVKVRPLKAADPRVAAIPALKPGPIATLYPISEQDARHLLRAAGVDGLPHGRRHGNSGDGRIGGAGFGSWQQNRRVEAAAVAAVTRYLRAAGWSVTDVSPENRGYDLLGTRGQAKLHVEVKGATGAAAKFPITVAEYDRWGRDRVFVLGLVTRALTDPQVRLFRGPASRTRFMVAPLSYMAQLRAGETLVSMQIAARKRSGRRATAGRRAGLRRTH